jgi:hypothetical protein
LDTFRVLRGCVELPALVLVGVPAVDDADEDNELDECSKDE